MQSLLYREKAVRSPMVQEKVHHICDITIVVISETEREKDIAQRSGRASRVQRI
jgi:predicted amino acid racemase